MTFALNYKCALRAQDDTMNPGLINGETKKGCKIFYDENAPKCLEVIFLETISATNKNYRAYSFTLDRL